jgi:putative CocE/NonD family hydrolase
MALRCFISTVCLWALVSAALAVEAPSAASAPRAVATSRYVTVRDGTRLAVDVVWTTGANKGELRRPAILMLTRYWRAFRSQDQPIDPSTYATIAYFTAAGYAVVIADMRGTGASFGSRDTEFSDAEVDDYGDLIDWIAKERWSNGRVATLGTSYLGNSAELATIPARPALRAVVPRFSDFSEYRDAVRPGGILNAVIAKAWVAITSALDRNEGCPAFAPGAACDPRAPWYLGVKPVDVDADGYLLTQAVAEHTGNADLASIVDHLTYSDDPFGRSSSPSVTLDSVSPSWRWRRIDDAHVPAFHWASWFDGGTAAGVLTRFINYRTPINVMIGAWNHGGTSEANPYVVHPTPASPSPSVQQQFDYIRAFLDPIMKVRDIAQTPTKGVIRYMTIGVNQWRTTTVWPPAGIEMHRWYLASGNTLASTEPDQIGGSDAYRVDFAATTGLHNRWHTQLGTYVEYPDRRDADRRLMTYTSPPVRDDTEITGSAVASISLKSTSPDGAVFAYLEDVSPKGRVTYLAEGQIRLLFRGPPSDGPGYHSVGPAHTFARAEVLPVKPDEVTVFAFTLNPTSVVVRRGHRIRLAIAGADADTFERLPASGETPVYTLMRGRSHSSYIEIPSAIWRSEIRRP